MTLKSGEKKTFNFSSPVAINDVDINKMLISNKFDDEKKKKKRRKE